MPDGNKRRPVAGDPRHGERNIRATLDKSPRDSLPSVGPLKHYNADGGKSSVKVETTAGGPRL